MKKKDVYLRKAKLPRKKWRKEGNERKKKKVINKRTNE